MTMQQLTANQMPSKANTHSRQRPRRFSQWFMQTLGIAMLACLTPLSEGSSLVEVPLPPIVVVGEPLDLHPTQDQLMRNFRAALGQPPTLVVTEHQFADGSLQMTTRFGRFCAGPPQGYLQSGLGGDIRLAAPCASF
jgi:hypothetical protein